MLTWRKDRVIFIHSITLMIYMKVCLLGVDFFSDNKGCAALGYSAVELLKEVCDERKEKLDVFAVVFNLDRRPLHIEGVNIELLRVAAKRLSYWKKCLGKFKDSDIVIDFTGGDSFSDIYGFKRFFIATLLKRLAIFSGTPFILGPQTIGPFKGKMAALMAKSILKKSRYCFARDAMSQKIAEKLANRKVLLSTDVAFSLPCHKSIIIDTKLNIGINPSGLLWYGSTGVQMGKYLSVDYRAYLTKLMEYLTSQTDYNIYLIPHVFYTDRDLNSNDTYCEDDLGVCRELVKLFPRAHIMGDYTTPMEAKGIISQMDIFTGARMHATIAAFSEGVAVIPFSYSRKFEGLYEGLDYPYIIGGTTMNTDEAITKSIEWIENADKLKEKIVESEPIIHKRKDIYMDVLRNIAKD